MNFCNKKKAQTIRSAKPLRKERTKERTQWKWVKASPDHIPCDQGADRMADILRVVLKDGLQAGSVRRRGKSSDQREARS